MIKMQLIGHLGRDAEVSANGTNNVINFNVAHTEKYTDSRGFKMEKTVWVSCSWWKDSTVVAQYLKKGTQVYVEGQPEVRMWENKKGEKSASLQLRVFSLQLLSSGQSSGSQQPATVQQPDSTGGYQPANTGAGEDLPF